MPKITDISFGQAIAYMKNGEKVTRESWNNKDIYVYYVPAAKYPASGNALGTMKGKYKDDLVPYQAYLAIKTKDDSVVSFVPGMDSMLAEDWEVVS